MYTRIKNKSKLSFKKVTEYKENETKQVKNKYIQNMKVKGKINYVSIYVYIQTNKQMN